MTGASESCLASIVLGFVPVFEPRYSAPILVECYGLYGIVVAYVEVFVLALFLSSLVDFLWGLLVRFSEKIPLLGVLVERVHNARRRVEGLVERYGLWGLTVFVAAPLPVTGMYTGAVVAMLLGVDKKSTLLALLIGGMASVAVTVLAYVAMIRMV